MPRPRRLTPELQQLKAIQERLPAREGGQPVALCTVRPSDPPYTHWEVIIPVCPYCGQPHSHSGGLLTEAPSVYHKLSHCEGGRGYFLQIFEPQSN
jgi:hypothetical protein